MTICKVVIHILHHICIMSWTLIQKITLQVLCANYNLLSTFYKHYIYKHNTQVICIRSYINGRRWLRTKQSKHVLMCTNGTLYCVILMIHLDSYRLEEAFTIPIKVINIHASWQWNTFHAQSYFLERMQEIVIWEALKSHCKNMK